MSALGAGIVVRSCPGSELPCSIIPSRKTHGGHDEFGAGALPTPAFNAEKVGKAEQSRTSSRVVFQSLL